MSKQTFFYATSNDVKAYIQDIEACIPLKYFLAGLKEKNSLAEYDSLLKYSNLGKAINTSKFHCDRFLVVHKDSKVLIEEIAQAKGGFKYEVSGVLNPDSIIFWPAGEIVEKNAIIEGIIVSSSNSDKSIELYNLFVKKIKKHFVKHGIHYLGVEAGDLLKKGWRFAESLERPEAYDLR